MKKIDRVNAITLIIRKNNDCANKCLEDYKKYNILGDKAGYYLAIANRLLNESIDWIKINEELINKKRINNA